MEIPTGPSGKDAVMSAVADLGLPQYWQLWAAWVAKGESGWSSNAWLGKAGDNRQLARREREAARDAHDRLVAEGRFPCPPDAAKWGIGSGGWYGQLAPYTAYHLARAGGPPDIYCDPHRAWTDPRASTVAHFRQVRGTLEILRAKVGASATFLQLRALYGLPSRDPTKVDTPERRKKYGTTLASAGISKAFLDVAVPALPEVRW